MKTNKTTKQNEEQLEERVLEGKAEALSKQFQILGMRLSDLEDISRRAKEGLDTGVYPIFEKREDGTLTHVGYGFITADKAEDVRTQPQRTEGKTNICFTNYRTAHIRYGNWYRRDHFCGNGCSFGILSTEYGTIGRVGEGETFEEQFDGPSVSEDMSEEELLRDCFEFALQRYTGNPNIRVEHK
jgi:hypothetical protein